MKRVKSYVALTSLVALFLLLLLVPGHRASAAQQTAQADDDPNLIDGAKNPELIEDSSLPHVLHRGDRNQSGMGQR